MATRAGISVVLAADHALHLHEGIGHIVPIIPRVLEDVGIVNLAIHSARVP